MDREDQASSTDREVAPVATPVGVLGLREGTNDDVLGNRDSWKVSGEVAFQC